MHRSRSLARHGLVLAVAGLLPVLAAVLSGAVHVTRCVAVPGGIAHVGVNLALLRPAAECPTGVALGGESEHMLAVAVLLTLPMLLLHVGVVAGTWGATAAVRRSMVRLARLVPWRRGPALRALVVPARLRAAVGTLVTPEWRTPAVVPLLRGPPAARPA